MAWCDRINCRSIGNRRIAQRQSRVRALLPWGYLSGKQITAARHKLDHVPFRITQCRAYFANTLKKAVFPDMNPGPDSIHQFLLADGTPVVCDEEFQQFKSFWAQLDDRAVRSVKRGAIWIEDEPSKTKHLLSPILI
ncbi:hypothetical protein J2W52_004165 [Rhizobium miluonense]|uniref:Uncharacterized protein n=1 Tax=Rhizobium miluonense TaxID=411945 RepID=A0ABU1SVT3_9HYPH|nr:hypothetical protein [Rhizobium miluonense]